MDDSVVVLKKGEKTYYLIPTAHISSKSVALVRQCAEELSPDSICIELDEARYESMMKKKEWDERSIFSVIKEKRVALLFVQIILASYQKRLGENFNVNSGAEMLEGARLANEQGCELVLADRSLQVTFNRVWRNLSFWEKCKLLYTLVESFFDDEDSISEEELEALKTKDMVQSAMEVLGDEFPGVKRHLVDERDSYLSQKIKNAPGKTVLAVLGAAHVDGVVRAIENNECIDITQLEKTVEKTPFQKLSSWFLPLLLVILVLFTFRQDSSLALGQIKQWIIYNGGLSGLFALLARANILSVLTAVLAAPITSLNPLLAAGWFAGLVEAFIRKPTVKDFVALSEDASSLKGLYKNRITRVLLVVIFANIGSTIGTLLASYGIFKIFLNLF